VIETEPLSASIMTGKVVICPKTRSDGATLADNRLLVGAAQLVTEAAGRP
jgi:hypothetical protein